MTNPDGGSGSVKASTTLKGLLVSAAEDQSVKYLHPRLTLHPTPYTLHPPGGVCIRTASEGTGNNFTGFEGLNLKAKALSVLYVPYSLDSGYGRVAALGSRASRPWKGGNTTPFQRQYYP